MPSWQMSQLQGTEGGGLWKHLFRFGWALTTTLAFMPALDISFLTILVKASDIKGMLRMGVLGSCSWFTLGGALLAMSMCL